MRKFTNAIDAMCHLMCHGGHCYKCHDHRLGTTFWLVTTTRLPALGK